MALQNSSNGVLFQGTVLSLTGMSASALLYNNGGSLGYINPATGTPFYNGSAWSFVSPITSGSNAGGDFTGTYPNPTIAANAVSFGKIQNIGTGLVLGNVSGSTGNVATLTAAQLSTLLGLGTAASATTGTAIGNVPVIGAGGLLPSSIIPIINFDAAQTVATNAAKLALTGLKIGDLVVVTADENRNNKRSTFVLSGTPISSESSWTLISEESFDAGSIVSGTMATARLGSGTANSSTYLRGDNTWATVTSTPKLPLTTVSGTTQQTVSDNIYIANGTAAQTFTLPATCNINDRVSVYGNTANGFTIAQNAGQTVRYQKLITTAGVSGSITTEVANTNSGYGTIDIVCIVANTSWLVMDSQGVFNVV